MVPSSEGRENFSEAVPVIAEKPLVLPSSEGRRKLGTTGTTVWFMVEYCHYIRWALQPISLLNYLVLSLTGSLLSLSAYPWTTSISLSPSTRTCLRESPTRHSSLHVPALSGLYSWYTLVGNPNGGVLWRMNQYPASIDPDQYLLVFGHYHNITQFGIRLTAFVELLLCLRMTMPPMCGLLRTETMELLWVYNSWFFFKIYTLRGPFVLTIVLPSSHYIDYCGEIGHEFAKPGVAVRARELDTTCTRRWSFLSGFSLNGYLWPSIPSYFRCGITSMHWPQPHTLLDETMNEMPPSSEKNKKNKKKKKKKKKRYIGGQSRGFPSI